MPDIEEKDTPSEIDRDKLRAKFASFSSLLDSIESIEDKKKALWKEIYENCVMDRENAFVMFMKLYQTVSGDAAQHAIHGGTITKYLERMNKANDQLIKLAELLQNAEKKNDTINPDDIFAQIAGNSK